MTCSDCDYEPIEYDDLEWYYGDPSQDGDPTIADMERETLEEDYCPFCGKEYEDWSDAGCGHCDARMRT